jgi:hypothetical protein
VGVPSPIGSTTETGACRARQGVSVAIQEYSGEDVETLRTFFGVLGLPLKTTHSHSSSSTTSRSRHCCASGSEGCHQPTVRAHVALESVHTEGEVDEALAKRKGWVTLLVTRDVRGLHR